MEIPRIEGPLLRVSTETARADPSFGLALGQQVTARVLAAGTGTALLEVAGQQLHARTAAPLVPGQQIQLQVTGLGAEIAMRLLGGGGVVSDRQLALATLATAHRAAPAPAPDLGALLTALETEVGGATAVDIRSRIAQLLGGLSAATDTSALAGRLRDALENSGLLFESRLRAWLQGLPGQAPAAGTPLPVTVAADLKVLLGVLGRALGMAGPPAAPVSEGALREAVLARQVETAYHWVRDGTLAMDLPLLLGGQTVTAQLRFRRGTHADDEDAPSAGAGSAGLFFDFALDPPGLGPVRAQAHLVGARLAVRFVVATPEVASLIDEEIASLRDGLGRDGIGLVRSDVTVDAGQARLAPLPPAELPRGGSVLDARA